jgi:DNA-binding CsgD family transcriptional regulator/tetratricopeptide (TPR) repeat protein
VTVSSPPGSSPCGPLVGRDEELDRLRHLLDDTMSGAGRSVWIEGEPGIGKSVLLESLLADAVRLGCRVRAGAAEEFGRHMPLHVMLDCFGAEPGADDPELREIAELLSYAAAAERPNDPAGVAAERLFALAERLSAAEPLVLFLDDLQWADEASVLMLHRLGRLAQRRALLIIMTCRPVPRRPDLATLKRGLIAYGAEVMSLSALAPAAVTRLTAELAGAPRPGPRLRRAADQAGGNPLYLRELVDALVREDRVRRHDDVAELADEPADAGFPRTLVDAVCDRLGFLSADTAELLRSAALLGSAFSVTELGAIVGRSARELTATLEEATAAGLLIESDVLLAFRHPLIRVALYERSPTGLRLALHLQAARALADAGLAVERVAAQLLSGLRGPGAVPAMDGWAVDWLLTAGRRLVRRAPEDAAELLGLAVGHLPTSDPRREPIEAVLAPALVLLGRRDEAVRLTETVLAATGDPGRAAEMSWVAGWALTDGDDHRAAEAVVDRGLRDPGLDETWSARLHAMLADTAIAAGDFTRADAATRLALAEVDRAGDRPAAAAALNADGTVQTKRGDLASAASRFDLALLIARQCDDPETDDLRLRILRNRAYVLVAENRLADADLAARELLADAERTAAPPRLAGARLLAAEVHYHAGRWDEAVAELDAAASVGELMPAADRRWLHGLAAVISVHRDDPVDAEEHLAAAPAGGGAELFAGATYVHQARALLAGWRNLTGEAFAVLADLFHRAGPGPAYRHTWLPSVLRLALREGDATLVRTIAAAASGSPPARRTAVDLHCTGLFESDPVTLRLAADAYGAAGRPLQRAQTLEDSAVALAAHGDVAAARTARAEALDLYTGLGARWDSLRADNRLRKHGVQRQRGPRRRAATGWEALTPTELRVARLVAGGHPNPDIAAMLYVSRRTVEVHVSHILSKLGVRSRVEIAREARSRFATDPEVDTAPSARAG